MKTLMLKRFIIVTICITLLTLRILLPNAGVDITTVLLVLIAAVALFLPDFRLLSPYIKRVKIGDFAEVELKEKIEKLDAEVKKAEDAASANKGPKTKNSDNISPDIEKILEESSKDPRAALLLLSSKLEQQLGRKLEQAGIDTGRDYSITRLVNRGVEANVFPKEFGAAFRDFASVRNQVAHGKAFDVDDSYILSLISLGTELLKAIS